MAAAKDGAVKANEVIKIKEILRKALDAANPSAVAFAVLALLSNHLARGRGAQPATRRVSLRRSEPCHYPKRPIASTKPRYHDGIRRDPRHPACAYRASRSAPGRWAAGCGAAPTKPNRSPPYAPRSIMASKLSTPRRSTASAAPRRSSARRLPTAFASDVMLATKVGLRWKDGKIYPQRQPRRASARRSTTRCGGCGPTVIDLYQVHWPDPKTPIEETAKAMRGSTIKAPFARSASAIFRSRRWTNSAARPRSTSAAAIQSVRACHRGRDFALLPRARHRDAGLWRALPRPSVRAHAAPIRNSRRRPRLRDPKFQPPRFAQYLAAVERLERFAQQRYGKRVIDLAVRFVLDQGITTALWGARRPDQLNPVEAAMGWSLDAAAKQEIDRILAEAITDPVGPEFMAPPEWS